MSPTCASHKRDGSPCANRVGACGDCCRYHRDRCDRHVVRVEVARTELFDPDLQARVLEFVRARVPWKAFLRQGESGNVLEDFCVDLLLRLFSDEERADWTCIAGRDGAYGIAGDLGKDELLHLLVLTPCVDFQVYLFRTP